MVDFKTRIFTESDNDIIGAEVIVFSDQGTRIGSIEIANAEDLNALREELEVIDETYFDETRLNAVLANSQESTTINATSISGYSSSDLAKVSQLSGYALTNHTHVKTSITDLYNYSISCSNYNPTIDTDISVTVKVTNQAGNPVVGHTVSILKNNSSWKSGTTGSNGEFTTTYTCSEWGLTTFSANNVKIQINVGGYRTTNPHQYYTVYEYQHRAGVRIHIPADISFTNAIKNINDSVIPHRLAPRYPVMQICANGITATANTAIGVRESADLQHTEIIVKSLSGADVSRNAYAYVEWDKKY